MPKIHETWTVLPHGPVTSIGAGLLTVDGDIPMPLGNFPRRMTAVRLSGGRALIWSAMALDENGMAAVEALGKPSFLVVPNPGHRLDAKIFKQRYPEIAVVTPPGAQSAVEEVVPVDSTDGDFGDPEVHFIIVDGTARKESALIVERPGHTTLITNDIIGHVTHPRGIGARIMARLFGYGVHRPQVPRTVRRFITDRKALAAQLRQWAELPNLKRLIVSHGTPIAAPAADLRRLAGELES